MSPKQTNSTPAPLAATGVLGRALHKVRSASSVVEGLRWLGQAVLRRAGLLRSPSLTRELVKQQKTGFWQESAGFEYFVSKNEPDPAKNPSASYLNAVVTDLFDRHCPRGARVLDVGCGNGWVSLYLARRGRFVTACDVSEPMLRLLAQARAGLEVGMARADAYRMPFADAGFDCIVARMFLYQFPDWPVVLSEMARCCRPGGRLLIHFTSRENLDLARSSAGQACDYGEVSDLRDIREGQEQAFIGAVDRRGIEKACRKIGLRVLERRPCTFFHYNRLIGHALGTEKFNDYRRQLEEHLKDPKVFDFVLWFERAAVEHLPAWSSYYNVLVLAKT